MQIGAKVKLEGKSRKGKNRIKEAGGNQFEVVDIKDRVFFSGMAGPWIRVENGTSKHGRWVHQDNDPDFSIVSID